MRPVRLSGTAARLVQGTPPLAGAPWAQAGGAVEVALGTEAPPPDWPGAVAVYLDGARLGWVNGGGEAMREALRQAWGLGAYVVVPGSVEVLSGAPVVRLALPRPAQVAAWAEAQERSARGV